MELQHVRGSKDTHYRLYDVGGMTDKGGYQQVRFYTIRRMTMTPIEAREGYIPVTGGRVWYQIVGAGDALPLLVLPGGPGFPSDYLESLAALADKRPVVFYDPLGCGKSDRPDDISLWRIERFAEEVEHVRQMLGLTQVHLLGHSGGTIVALEYLLGKPAGVMSLIQVGPLLSIPRQLNEMKRLLATLPAEMQAAAIHHEAAGTIESKEYQQVDREFGRRFGCRVPVLERPASRIGQQVIETLYGPTVISFTEHLLTGNMKDYDRSDRAHELTVPTLFLCGRYDLCTPEETSRYHQLVPGSEMVVFEQSSHSPYVEESERFLQVVRDFLRRVEARLGELLCFRPLPLLFVYLLSQPLLNGTGTHGGTHNGTFD
jgi:proline iminopeptidase